MQKKCQKIDLIRWTVKKIKRERRLILAILVVLILIAGCSSEADNLIEEKDRSSSTEEVILEIGMLGTTIKPVAVIIAESNGFFEEEGVVVKFQKVSSMNDAYLAVANGDLDIYLFSSTAAATFITQGTTTLRVFGGTVSEGSEIMAAKGKGIQIKKAEDFVGKTIACQMPETGQMVLKDYLKKEGYTIGSPDEDVDVKFIYVNDSHTAMEGCVKGEYDLCITNASLGYYADDFGIDVVATVKDFVNPYPCCRQTCYEGSYTEKNDDLVKFEIAALRGYEFYLNNEEKTLDILEAYSGEKRDFLKAQIYGTENYTPIMRVSLDPDKKATVGFYKALDNIGEIENALEVDWDQYVVTDIYEKALATLVEREPDNALWTDLRDYFKMHN